MAARNPRSHDDYTVGWICALPVEMAAAKLMLDEVHGDLPVSSTDHNSYTFGSIQEHNVVIACLPSGDYGLVSANTVAMQLLSSFHSIRFGLMVGIGGGVPNSVADIRLGDVVVSKPTGTHGGVVQYDYGKALSGEFQRTGMLNRPPQILLTALSKLQSNHLTEDSRIADFLSEVKQKIPHRASKFARPAQEDHLYLSDYHHVDSSTTCDACDSTRTVSRPSRDHNEPLVHYGLIASGNQLIRDSGLRDRLRDDLGVFCVEMEAAGLSNNFPCLVIRGICDYADSHKNKEWQGYASAVAAAYAKELLLCTSVRHVNHVQTVPDPLSNATEFHVPFDLTGVPAIDNFLGRHEELDHLWQYLQPEEKGSRKVAVLHGMGGIGKTQLAIRFIRKHKEQFTAIFWLPGKSRETLLQSLGSMSSRLPGQSRKPGPINKGEMERNAKRVLGWLAMPKNTRWLLIFDNIDQYSPGTDGGYDIEKYFPTADHGSILITSRLQSITELGQAFALQGFNSEDAISLLWQSRHLPIPDTAASRDQAVIDLLDRLGGLPLAITIAGSFMRETGTNIDEYLQYYQKSWHALQSDAKPGRHYQQGNILQTWSVSYEEIKRRDSDIAELLLLLAHFDNRDIWYELLESGKHYPNPPLWFTEVLSDKLVFKTRIRILIEFSLISINENRGSYMMHPVVQDWCLDVARIEGKPRIRRWDELTLCSVGHMVRILQPHSWELRRRLLIHAEFVCQLWMSQPPSIDVNVLEGAHLIGILYSIQEKLKEAEIICQWALAGYKKALGPDDTSTLKLIEHIARLYRDQGKWEESETMFQQAIAGSERTLGLCNPSALEIVNDLGNLYADQAKWIEAEAMFQRALLGFEKSLGPDHQYTLKATQNLGNLFRKQEKWKDSETMFQQAISRSERSVGPNECSTLEIVNDLGRLYADQRKWIEAESMFQRALSGFEKSLGPDHHYTLNTVFDIAIQYTFQSRWNDAETLFQRAVAGYKKARGPDDPLTLHAVWGLGTYYRARGRREEAEVLYQQALTGYKRTLWSDHRYTLTSLQSMGDFYREQGKLDQAMTMYQEAWAGYVNTLGPDHDATSRVHLKIEEIMQTRSSSNEQRRCSTISEP